MIMCSKCHKRMAVVFITKMEDGQRTSEGLCLRCARESGLPVNQALDDITKRMGITPEQLENMEDSVTDALVPSDQDDLEDGGAPAIDIPRLFEDMGLAELAASDQRQVNRPSGERGAGRRQPEDHKSGAKEKKQLKFLPTYCTCLTDAAREGKLDSIVGRERELARVTQILCRRQKNNPCLIGEPGVGKTAIAEALAIRIATGQVPYKLRGKEVWLVDLTALVAGTPFRFAFSYSKYMKLLGLDPETGTCDEYMYAVLAIKADEMLVNGNVNFFYFTAGSDVLDFGKMADDSFENDGKWQYLLFDMEEDSGWYADLKGGTFFIGSGGSEPGTKVRIAEFVLFKTYAEAMKYAGFTTGEETATDTDTVTVTETATEQVTQTESTVPMPDSATSGDTAEQTGAETGKSGGCSSAVGGGILLCVLPAAWILQRRRREGKR